MPDELKIALPLWLVTRAEDTDTSDPLLPGKVKLVNPTWLTGDAPSGKVLMAFTDNVEASLFVSKHFTNPAHYVNAELKAAELILVLDSCNDLEIQAVR